jgi:hypothetical protein
MCSEVAAIQLHQEAGSHAYKALELGSLA